MIILDASVLIAYLAGEDIHHEAAEHLLVDVVDEDLAVNSLTLAEVLVAPLRDGHLDLVMAALDALEVQELAFPDDAAIRLARLRAETALKMPDCCVLLAAEEVGGGVATFDARLGQTATGRGLTVVGGERR